MLVYEKTNLINKDIGLTQRRSTIGPEELLIEEFIHILKNTKINSKFETIIFREPWLESGAPDLVIARYRPQVFQSWQEARNILTIRDIKLIHFLHTNDNFNQEEIAKILCIKPKGAKETLERLFESGILKKKHGIMSMVSFKKIFGIHSLIAIEAKTKNSRVLFEQAQINKWFASESYTLSPGAKKPTTLIDRAAAHGVGVYTVAHSKLQRLVKSPRFSLPNSYATWLFNEWVGRLAN